MKKFSFLMLLVYFSLVSLAQNAEEESIKKAIHDEMNAYASRDMNNWKTTWQHSPHAAFTLISRNGYTAVSGWDSLEARFMRDVQQNPKPNTAKFRTEFNSIQNNGNLAVVDYYMISTPTMDESAIFPYTGELRYHNYATLVKDDGQWKWQSRVATLPQSYQGEHSVEMNMNNTGYELLALNKITEAIEVFKLNVKLFPNSWNTWDSLGEAYAIAGDKKKAIENYEKSIKLNPKSETGPPALVKLKQK